MDELVTVVPAGGYPDDGPGGSSGVYFRDEDGGIPVPAVLVLVMGPDPAALDAVHVHGHGFYLERGRDGVRALETQAEASHLEASFILCSTIDSRARYGNIFTHPVIVLRNGAAPDDLFCIDKGRRYPAYPMFAVIDIKQFINECRRIRALWQIKRQYYSFRHRTDRMDVRLDLGLDI